MAYIFDYEAKLRASLKWLFVKAFCNCVPAKYQEPYFEENELGKSLRNDIVKILISGHLYCQTCKNIYNEYNVIYDSIESVIQMLSRNSIHVTDENDEPVTASLITSDSPFYVSAHIALIDSLMIAYSTRAMSLNNVVISIRKYTNFNASSDLPSTDLESICLFWLNKIIKTFLYTIDCECDVYSKQLNIKCQSHLFISQIKDITTHLANGTILAALILFYTCDTDVDISLATFQEAVGLEESVENLHLVKDFCDKYIASKPFYFNYEDFLYSPLNLKINKIAFIAELYYWFEIKPLVCCKTFNDFKEYIKQYSRKHFHITTPFMSPKISDVTRNSFMKGSCLSLNQTKTINEPVQSNNGPLPSNQVLLDKRKTILIDSKVNDTNNRLPNTTNNSTNINLSINSSLLDQVSLENSNNFDLIKANINNDQQEQLSSRTYVKYSHNNKSESINDIENNNNNKMFDTTTTTTNSTNIFNSNNIFISTPKEPPILSSTSSSVSPKHPTTTYYMYNGHTIKSETIPPPVQPYLEIYSKSTSSSSPVPVQQNEQKPVSPKPVIQIQEQIQQSQQQLKQLPLEQQVINKIPNPSLTAYPGDIFYKVKDVTESSTSDTLESFEEKQLINNNNNENINLNSPKKSIKFDTTQPTTTWKKQAIVHNNENGNNNNTNNNITSTNSNNNETTTITTTTTTTNDKVKVDDNLISKELIAIRQAMEARRLNMMLNLRMQLEEKKRAMERDKRKLETQMEKQRQNIGKQAFLQVVQQQKKQINTTNNNEPTSLVNNNNNKIDDNNIIVEDLETTTTTTTIIATNNNNNNNNNLNINLPLAVNTNGFHNTNKSNELNNIKNNLFDNLQNLKDNSPRKLWDKTHKNIDITETSVSSIDNNNKQQTNVVDLSKPYYSREEVLKVIEAAAKQQKNKITTSSLAQDVENLDAKLNVIQTELSRIHVNKPPSPSAVLKVTTIPPLNNLNENHNNNEKSLSLNTSPKEFDNNEDDDDELSDNNNAFFISFGDNKQPLKEKPILTEKKNLIFYNQQKIITNNKTNKIIEQKQQQQKKTRQQEQEESEIKIIKTTNKNGVLNEVIVNNYDEMEKRKEMIMQRQIKRLEQLELIRIKREEERARQAEEQRHKDEEQNYKKQLEKTRKDAIFKAYIEKKKQMQDEIGGVIGKPRRHEQRIRASPSQQRLQSTTNNINDDLNDLDYINNTERSNSHMSKTYSTNNLNILNHNNINNNNHHHNNNNNNHIDVQVKQNKKPSCLPPPVCARPTISSLRKMNRTFSLNNVSNIQQQTLQLPPSQQQQQQQQHQEQQQNHHNHYDYDNENDKSINNSNNNNNNKLSGSTPSTPTSINNENNNINHINGVNTFFSPSSLKSTSSSNSATTSNTNGLLKQQAIQPQQTPLTHPKRRTPRNAEEFLEAAGIDSEFFVSKGYYVGSMYNLNDIQPNTAKNQPTQQQQQQQQIKTKQTQRSLSLIKRKNSLIETASMSLANLTLFNQYNDLNDKQNNTNNKTNNKRLTELSLFNEYFIDKTYKYVNNNNTNNNNNHNNSNGNNNNNNNDDDDDDDNELIDYSFINNHNDLNDDISQSTALPNNNHSPTTSTTTTTNNSKLIYNKQINTNNNDSGTSRLTIAKSMSNLNGGGINSNNLIINTNKNNNYVSPIKPNERILPSTSLYSFQTITKNSPPPSISNNALNTSHTAFNNNNNATHNASISNINHTDNSDYSGPKLYKRITGKSNKLTIVNSLNQLVLAGPVNTQLRKQVLEEIDSSDARHFVVLFRDYHLQYRGIYSYLPETDYIEKIVGQGPSRISEDMIEKYYKYNSGGKQFSPVPTKHFSVQCDGVTIHNIFWQSRKSSATANTVLTSPMQMNYSTLSKS